MIRENATIISLLILVAIGLGFLYYSVSLTESAQTDIGNIENFPKGSLVSISGQITKISKSKSGNIYWTVEDETGNIVVPLLGKIADNYRNISKDSQVFISGLITEYQNSLEISPKTIEVKND